ncbi:hypothetical protein [Helicobacter rodentium]|uniref:hypothetical protein n=1 Tax=Helicobacter rodentium TaxID=59617 RepID=UPI0023563457|nr:hypothetical protein [Helicobacter rodentium]
MLNYFRFSTLSLRECVAFVAIYNRAYPRFYNGIPKAVLYYGLLRCVRNDEAADFLSLREIL